jgi:hypothetical protein
VSSLGSAVYTIVSYQLPTFSYEVSVLSAVSSIIPSITDDLSVLTYIEVESPSIYYAESTIEASFYGSPSIASAIYYAIDYPSLVSSPSTIAYEEESHESLVSAISYLNSWEAYYTSSASTLSSVEYNLISAFESYRTLLTAYSYVQDITSPSIASATASFLSAKNSDSSLTYVLTQVSYVISYLPSISCYESVIEYYAAAYPSVATYIWSVIDGQYYIASSSAYSFQYYVDEYYTLYQAFEPILGGMIDYSFLLSLESSFIYAAESDSSILTQYELISSASSSAQYYYSTLSTSSISVASC